MRKLVFSALSILILASLVLSGCAAPAEPETIIQTVEVEREVTVVETREVVVTQEVVVEATPAPSAQTYERTETLYTGGTQWGPPAGFNPWNLGNYAVGTFGLCYESLFLYDPLEDEFLPWLAESGEWIDEDTYEVKLREGITWSTGEPFTAADVKFTFDAAQEAPVSISPVWQFLGSVEQIDDYTAQFNFNEALYQRWSNYLYTTPIVSQASWQDKSVEEITSGINENPECTGPYRPESLEQDRVVWVKGDGWWATDALGLDPKPTRIVDIVNSSNNVALGLFIQGGLDLSTHFLPGMSTILESGAYSNIKTYYPEPPYMLSANTAWLLMNLQTPPMDDLAFRQAMAYAIDTQQIADVVYGNIVQASNPTGLLPTWEQYIDQDVVDELGFSYDPEKARQILADAGYVDVDGDGFVEMPDGSPIELFLNGPNGWTDWMESIRTIANAAQAVGINVQPNFPDYPAYLDERNQGTFEMMIANDAQLSNTPWTYYNWMFQNPIEDIATIQNGNYGRYDNPEVFALVDQLDQVPSDDVEGMRAVMSELQRIHLTDLPLIPLWYNGMWSQVNNAYWTNWPSSEEGSNHYLPSVWRGYWNMTGILMLSDLEPAGQ